MWWVGSSITSASNWNIVHRFSRYHTRYHVYNKSNCTMYTSLSYGITSQNNQTEINPWKYWHFIEFMYIDEMYDYISGSKVWKDYFVLWVCFFFFLPTWEICRFKRTDGADHLHHISAFALQLCMELIQSGCQVCEKSQVSLPHTNWQFFLILVSWRQEHSDVRQQVDYSLQCVAVAQPNQINALGFMLLQLTKSSPFEWIILVTGVIVWEKYKMLSTSAW